MSGGEAANAMTCMEGTCAAGSGCDPISMTCLPLCLPNGDCPEGRQCTGDGLALWTLRVHKHLIVREPWYATPVKGCVAAGRKVCEREGDLRCSKSRERGYEYCDLCSMQCRPVAGSCGECQTDAQCGDRALCAKTIVAGTETTTGTCLRTCSTDANCELIGPTFECAEVRPGRKACAPRAGNQCEEVPACQMDADCPPDRYCESGRCLQGCTEGGCPVGNLCQGLRCGPPCQTGEDCQDGLECQPDGRCKVPNGCATSAECLEPETFCDRNALMCVAGCEVDNDCGDASKECSSGRCVDRAVPLHINALLSKFVIWKPDSVRMSDDIARWAATQNR